jgi:hypothetical protein
MFQKLVSHNEDIRRLVEKGYAVGFDSSYLVIRDIPYLDGTGALRNGAFVTKLEFIDNERVIQQDHQVFFAGGVPHQIDCIPVQNLGGAATSLLLSGQCADVIVERSFSNKPLAAGKFIDFFEKIESYVRIVSGPAIERHNASPLTFNVDSTTIDSKIFKYQDTLTSRAEIGELADRFKGEVIAVIGLGGTGAYVLDFLVKTPVAMIRAFDLDPFHVHNAFRSPGRLDSTELGKTKSEVYMGRYENFRHGLQITPKFLDATCRDELLGVTFAFVCVDSGASRASIFELLINMGIPFIDVGMGLDKKRGALNGMARVTYFPPDRAAAMRDMQLAELNDSPNDMYKSNIQIGELNALNACLAVIRYKQLRGFYFEESPGLHQLFEIGTSKIIAECEFDEN